MARRNAKIKEVKTAEVKIDDNALNELETSTEEVTTSPEEAVEDTVEETVEAVDEEVSEPETVEEENTLENFLKEEAEKENNKPSGKTVKIKLRENHHCTIAKTRYDFVAGVIYSVPQNVKDILDRGGYLTAI